MQQEFNIVPDFIVVKEEIFKFVNFISKNINKTISNSSVFRMLLHTMNYMFHEDTKYHTPSNALKGSTRSQMHCYARNFIEKNIFYQFHYNVVNETIDTHTLIYIHIYTHT